MSRPIPYGRQHITDGDISVVVEALKSDYLTQGPRINEFEEAFAEYVGSKYAVAVANGTAALHLNAIALGVEPGKKVITTPITFAASANCVRYCGGEVVFSDINPDTYLLDIDNVRALIESSPKGTYSGIIPVDFAGRSVDLEAFRQLADEHDLWIIEDACHAPGASFINSLGETTKAGSGRYADLAIFSFHPVKHIAAGEGGMITTDDQELYERLLNLRTHGISRDASRFQNSMDIATGHQSNASDQYPGWYMEMQELGYNYRITDFQAALGASQLKRAEPGIARRRTIAARYKDAFKDLKEVLDKNPGDDGHHAYHLYVIEAERRLDLYNHLRSKSIFVQIHYIPLHLMPYYKRDGVIFHQSEAYYQRCLSLPMFPTLTDEEQEFVIDEIRRFYKQ
ncbi:MAG: UDP-4-amino-4,6-dideoxy-N-acetyl-beta-L-altrosamine transaminase [Flavobacteriales bacterium]|nr:UDP-4-amino-4,6-dideoxy-N-acetyl-beta-L-altrosamine transaminase [Flavobacteriales bacterium]